MRAKEYRVPEGETRNFSADGSFTVTVKDGVAVIVPDTYCFSDDGPAVPPVKKQEPVIEVKLPVQYDMTVDIITAIQRIASNHIGCPIDERTTHEMKQALLRALNQAVQWEELVEVPEFNVVPDPGNPRKITIQWKDPTFWYRWNQDHTARPKY